MLSEQSLARAIECALESDAKKAENGLSLLLAASRAVLLSYAANLPVPEEYKNKKCKERFAKKANELLGVVNEALNKSSEEAPALSKETAFLSLLAGSLSGGAAPLSASDVFLPVPAPDAVTPGALAGAISTLAPYALLPEACFPREIDAFLGSYGDALAACLPTHGEYPLGISAEDAALLRLLLLRRGLSVSLRPFPRRYTTPLYAAFCDTMDGIFSILSYKASPSEEMSVATLEHDAPVTAIVHQKAREASFFSDGGPRLFFAPRRGKTAVEMRFGGGLRPVNGRVRVEGEEISSVSYKGGFLVYGRTAIYEGDTPGDTPVSESRRAVTAFAAAVLPDDETVLCLESILEKASDAVLWGPLSFAFSTVGEGLLYANDKRKTYKPRANPYTDNLSNYLNIEDEVGAVFDRPLCFTFHRGQGEVYPTAKAPLPAATSDVPSAIGDAPSHAACVFTVGGIRRTRAATDAFLTLAGLPSGVLSVSAVAANRKRYTLLYNTTDAPFDWDGRSLPPHAAVLLSWDRS